MTAASKKAASKGAAKATAAEPEKAKRKSYTPEEKIAKLEADLAAAREKATEHKAKAVESLKAKVEKQREKADAERKKLAEMEAELDAEMRGGTIDDSVVMGAEVGDDPIIAAAETDAA